MTPTTFIPPTEPDAAAHLRAPAHIRRSSFTHSAPPPGAERGAALLPTPARPLTPVIRALRLSQACPASLRCGNRTHQNGDFRSRGERAA